MSYSKKAIFDKEKLPKLASRNFGKLLKKTIKRTLTNKKDLIKTVWIYDSHYPQNINMAPILEFIKDFKPDVIGFGGDNWSMDPVSRHDYDALKNKGYRPTFEKFLKEAEGFKAQIKAFMDSAPRAKFVYILGNHEDWLEQFCRAYPQIKAPSVQSLLGEISDKIEFVTRGGFYTIGKLNFCHGDQFGTQNPAKQAMDRVRSGTIVMGHHHVFKVWPAFGMIDAEEKHLGIQVPCYCKLAPGYLKGRPTAWMNGFFTATVKKKTGKFSAFVQLVSPKGEFMTQAGKEYS